MPERIEKMSQTLGEKLREAREERGISLSEVAEQTRISPIYLESIENDDYRNLPGGIFNKGFVKSFAKYVGISEQEAMLDYSKLVSVAATPEESDVKVYRPEVLTDGGPGGSMIPTAIVAVIILALMTTGILFLVNYLRRPAETPVANLNNNRPVTNANQEQPAATPETPVSGAPDMATLQVELQSLGQPVKVFVTSDGVKSVSNLNADSPVSLTPKESLTINYIRWNAQAVKMKLNGKEIALPAQPLTPADRDRIIFTISKDNLAQIWTSGSVTGEAPTVETTPEASANVAPPVATPTAQQQQQRPTPQPPRPATPAATSTAATPVPQPTRKVIVVGNANRPE